MGLVLERVHEKIDSFAWVLGNTRGSDRQEPEIQKGFRYVDLTKWVGYFSEGYTASDIDFVMPEISEKLGIPLICIWNTEDEFDGLCGDSEFFFYNPATGDLQPLPEMAYEILLCETDEHEGLNSNLITIDNSIVPYIEDVPHLKTYNYLSGTRP